MDVAQAGYDGLMAGRRVVVPGFRTQLEVFLVRFLPRSAVVRTAHEMLRREP
jgi:short-subunit dehydrogenase